MSESFDCMHEGCSLIFALVCVTTLLNVDYGEIWKPERELMLDLHEYVQYVCVCGGWQP